MVGNGLCVCQAESSSPAEDGGNAACCDARPEDGGVAVAPAVDTTPAFSEEPSPQRAHRGETPEHAPLCTRAGAHYSPFTL